MKLIDICSIRRGASPRPISKYETQFPTLNKWAKISDLENYEVSETKNFLNISDKEWNKLMICNKGELLLTCCGSPGIPFINNVANCGYHDGFIKLVPNEKIILKEYLFWYLIASHTKIISKAKGPVFKNLNIDIVSNLDIFVPSLSEQKNIIKIIKQYHNDTNLCIENSENVIQNLIKKKNHYEKLALSYKNNYEKVKLVDYCYLNRYNQISASTLESLNSNEGDVALLPSSKNFGWYTKSEYVKNMVCNGTVITLGRARYSNIKYWSGSFISSNNIIIESKNPNELHPKYLYYLLKFLEKDIYTPSATYPKFDLKKFKNIYVWIPKIEEQKKIAEHLDNLNASIEEIKKTIQYNCSLQNKQIVYYLSKIFNIGSE